MGQQYELYNKFQKVMNLFQTSTQEEFEEARREAAMACVKADELLTELQDAITLSANRQIDLHNQLSDSDIKCSRLQLLLTEANAHADRLYFRCANIQSENDDYRKIIKNRMRLAPEELLHILQGEINWCLDNPDPELNNDQQMGFVNGLRQATLLLEKAEKVIEINDLDHTKQTDKRESKRGKNEQR